jgi:hypothetical protein
MKVAADIEGIRLNGELEITKLRMQNKHELEMARMLQKTEKEKRRGRREDRKHGHVHSAGMSTCLLNSWL